MPKSPKAEAVPEQHVTARDLEAKRNGHVQGIIDEIGDIVKTSIKLSGKLELVLASPTGDLNQDYQAVSQMFEVLGEMQATARDIHNQCGTISILQDLINDATDR